MLIPAVDKPVVLIADDEVVVRNFMAACLDRMGCEVLSAAHGLEALELSRQYPGHIDLVITDISMPRMTGPELCAHLSKERPATRAMLVTGQDAERDAATGIPLMRKPFTPTQLIAEVRRLLTP